MNYKNNIWKLYAIRFFQNLIPAYVIERLFWELRGMTIQMVVYTEIIYAVIIVLLEIPTGILADKWGRKRMMVLSGLFCCCEFFILVFATKFWHFAAAVLLAGIGNAAASGSENALLYDSLKLEGKEYSFEKCLGRLNAFDFSAALLAALSGSLLANRFGFELNYWLSFAAASVGLFLAFTLKEPEIRSEEDEPISNASYVKTSLGFFRENPGVCLVLLSAMVCGAALNFIDEFWQIYLNRLEIPVLYFGLFSAGGMLFRLPGNVLAYALKNRFSYKALLSGVASIFAVGLFYISFVKGYSSLAVILVIFAVSGILEPITAGYLHHRIESTMRATIDSFQSLGFRAIMVLTSLGFGYFSSRYDVFGGYGFLSVICGLFLVYFLVFYKQPLNEIEDTAEE